MTGLIRKLKSNPIDIRKVIVGEALLVTLAAHLLLLFLFGYRPLIAPQTNARAAEITLYNLEKAAPERREVAAEWLAAHDPGAIARSDAAGSPLTRLSRPGRPEPARRDIGEPELTAAERLALAPQTLPVTALPPSLRLPGEDGGPEFKLTLPPRRFPEAISDGRLLEVKFTAETLELAARIGAADTTLLFRRGAGDEVRFQVLRSSGSPKLDMLAVRQLLSGGFKPGNYVEVTIRWNPEGHGK